MDANKKHGRQFFSAVLCCRAGQACSFVDGSEYLLHEEGPVVGAEGHMRCYHCVWDERDEVWIASKEAAECERICPTSICLAIMGTKK